MRYEDTVESFQQTYDNSGSPTVVRSINSATEIVSRADVVESDHVQPTAYTADVIRQYPGLGTVNYRRNVWATDKNGVWGWHPVKEPALKRHTGLIFQPHVAAASYDPAVLRGEALTKLRLALKDQKIDLAVAYAFRKETVATIADSSKLLIQLASAFRKKNWKQAASALRKYGGKSKSTVRNVSTGAANWWLAYWFGIMPIIDDINGLLEEIARAPEPSPIKVSGRAKRSYTSSGHDIVWGPDFSEFGPEQYNFWRDYEQTDIISCRAFATVRVTSQSVRDAARNGLLNPLVVAYDLAKYSFVLGWVVSIGEFIRSLDATAGTVLVAGCFSEQHVTHTDTQFSGKMRQGPVNGIHYQWFSEGNISTTHEHKRFVRTPFSSIGMPALYLKNPLDSWIVATAAALIAQATAEKGNWERKRPAFSYKRPRVKYLPPIKYTKV